MGTISYTIPTAGSTDFAVAAPEVDTALQTLLTWANGNIDGANVAATLTGRRLIGQAPAILSVNQTGIGVSGNFLVLANGGIAGGGSNLAIPLMWWNLDPSIYGITGKSNTQLIVRLSYAVNNVAPAVTITAGLASFTTGGSSSNLSFTFGSMQGSTVSVATPGANSMGAVETAAFAAPSTGNYGAAININTGLATNTAVSLMFQVFVLNS